MTTQALDRDERIEAWADATVRHYETTGILDAGASKVMMEMIQFEHQRTQTAYYSELERRMEAVS